MSHALPEEDPTYVVGIGASAGGLEALQRLFQALPADTGMAFVVVQHLSPDFKSLMHELLARHTRMPIVLVNEAVRLRPNTVFLLPPRKEIFVEGEQLQPVDRLPDERINMPINRLFQSLAREKGDKAIAIILSGTGSDGSLGIMDIHDLGGMVLVQNGESAKFDGMPRSAIATGAANWVLPPEDMAMLLERYSRNPALTVAPSGAPLAEAEDGLNAIFAALHQSSGIDFSQYKPATIMRRIERRMALGNFASLELYARRVQEDANEFDQLSRDLLIVVTRFFRDPEAFRVLQERVIPDLVRSALPQEEVRVWVPGCATGEEAYSLAILLLQEFDRQHRPALLKVFASDMHADSLRQATEGVYSEEALQSVPAEVREAFFTREPDGRYRVVARLRRSMLFSSHNVIKDVPFNRIDLVSCRNLLIYLQPAAQTRALTGFHFALKLKGTLFLGCSESVGELEGDFESLDHEWKIFRKASETRLSLNLRVRPSTMLNPTKAVPTGDPRLARVYEELMNRYLPAGVLVNDRREALHLFGDANRFLRPAVGRSTQDLVLMCDGDLRVALSSALQGVFQRRERVELRRVPVPTLQGPCLVDVRADPLEDRSTKSLFAVVLFHSEPVAEISSRSGNELELDTEARNRVHHLETELRDTRESLQSLVEELETTNEELQATNEELLASNEELQSTNEELHSVNEELYSVNAEHEQKIRDLAASSADLRNLMAATHTGIIFTDRDKVIRTFTPGAGEILNLLPHDIGRPLEHITSRIKDDEMISDLRQVEEQREPKERELTTPEGHCLLRRILPYQDGDKRPGGFVITFIDITARKQAESAEAEKRTLLMAILNASKSNMAVINRDSVIVATNEAWNRFHLENGGIGDGAAVGVNYLKACKASVEDSYAREAITLIEDVLEGRRVEANMDYPCHSKSEERWFWMNVSSFPAAGGGAVITHTDITERKQAEHSLRESELRFRQMADDAPVLIWQSDAKGQRTFFNRTWLKLTGRTFEQEVNNGWWEGVHPDDRDQLKEAYTQAIARRRELKTEYRLRRADGTFAWIQAHGAPRWDAQGCFLGLIACCSDVTQQRRSVEERQEMEQKLQEAAKLESLGVLAGGIAHDFNNILTGILGNVTMALMDLPTGSPVRSMLDSVKDSSLRAAALCQQMLAYSGRSRFLIKEADLGWVVQDSVNLIRASINKNVTLELNLAQGNPKAEMDVSQIQQVVMNLVINASEAIGDRGGVIRISTGAIRGVDSFDGEEIVGPEATGDFLFLEVADNGCGISSDHIRRIFEPFFSTKFTGRGLGLAAVLGIIRGHKGGLRVRSHLGQGTVFHLSIPWRPGRSVEPTVDRLPELTPGNGRLLVIDDEESVRTAMGRILERFGYEVVLAANGTDGVRLFSEAPDRFRGVVLDLTMPGLNGVQTFAALRQVSPGVRVLLASGYSESEVSDLFVETKPAGFLQKPLSLDQLVRAVQSAFSGS